MSVLLRRVTIQNYKSIAKCRVDLGSLSLLVGPNGSGKSNFLDAIRLISDGLETSLEHAIRQRGGIQDVRRRSSGHPTHFAIGLRIKLLNSGNASFAFKVGAYADGEFRVQHEQAAISCPEYEASYEVYNGELTKFEVREESALSTNEILHTPAKILPDRLLLAALASRPAFRPLFDALSGMGFYNINPVLIREPQPHHSGEKLQRDGGNIASVIKRLEVDDSKALERIQDYVRRIVPGLDSVHYKALGPRETLEFRQAVPGAKHPWRFYAANMSDGTLRSLGVLTALFQSKNRRNKSVPLVAIEEPESTIHPGAAGIVMDALLEASQNSQVLVTTHSPDLLDHDAIEDAQILAVKNVDGETIIAPTDQASLSAIKDRLATAGELLRKNQLQPDEKQKPGPIKDSDLFERV
ncbi:MAG: AAA family ATPase [Rhodospirillales bacterium]|nr:AAA family ATPase [Rhodospirillales bacterium]